VQFQSEAEIAESEALVWAARGTEGLLVPNILWATWNNWLAMNDAFGSVYCHLGDKLTGRQSIGWASNQLGNNQLGNNQLGDTFRSTGRHNID